MADKKKAPTAPTVRNTKDLDVYVHFNEGTSNWVVVPKGTKGSRQLQTRDIPRLQQYALFSRDADLLSATLAMSQLTLVKSNPKKDDKVPPAVTRSDKPLKTVITGFLTGLLACTSPDEFIHNLVAFYRIQSKHASNSIAAASLAVYAQKMVATKTVTFLNTAVNHLGALAAVEIDKENIIMPDADDLDGEPATSLTLVQCGLGFQLAVTSSEPVQAMAYVHLLAMHTSKDVRHRTKYHMRLCPPPDEGALTLVPDDGKQATEPSDFRTLLRQWCTLVVESFPCKDKKKKKKDDDEEEDAKDSRRGTKQMVKNVVASYCSIMAPCGNDAMLAAAALCVFLCRHAQWATIEQQKEDYTDKEFEKSVRELDGKVTKLTKSLLGTTIAKDAFDSQTSVGEDMGISVQDDVKARGAVLECDDADSNVNAIVKAFKDAVADTPRSVADIINIHQQSYGVAGTKKQRHRAVKGGGGVAPLPKGTKKGTGKKAKVAAKAVTVDPLPEISFGEDGLNVTRVFRWSLPATGRKPKCDTFVLKVEDSDDGVSFWGAQVPNVDKLDFTFQSNLDTLKALLGCTSSGVVAVEYNADEPSILMWRLPFSSEPPLMSIANISGDDAEFVNFEEWEGGRLQELQTVADDLEWTKERAESVLRLLAVRSLVNVNNNNFTTIYYDKVDDTFASIDMPASNRQVSWDENTPWTGVLFKGTRKASAGVLADGLYPHLPSVVTALRSDVFDTAVKEKQFEFAISGRVKTEGRVNIMCAALEASISEWDPKAKPAPKKKKAKTVTKEPAAKKRRVKFEEEEEEEEDDEEEEEEDDEEEDDGDEDGDVIE